MWVCATVTIGGSATLTTSSSTREEFEAISWVLTSLATAVTLMKMSPEKSWAALTIISRGQEQPSFVVGDRVRVGTEVGAGVVGRLEGAGEVGDGVGTRVGSGEGASVGP